MLVPIIIVLGGVAAYKAWKRPAKAGLTGERLAIYNAAIVSLKEPEKLEQLASVFEGEGLREHATVLRQRAKLRGLPPKIKRERREIFSRAIKSTNVAGIKAVADAFERDGAIGAASELRRHAESLLLHDEPAPPIQEMEIPESVETEAVEEQAEEVPADPEPQEASAESDAP